MKITIETTSKIVDLDGVPARIWEGTTESGIPVHCFITRIAINKDDEAANEQFRRELAEVRPPSADVEKAYPLRMVL